MAIYGVDFYGASRYGPRIFLDFDASPMRALSREYGRIDVSWNSPGGSWSILRVVRNAFGTPVSATDGQTLVETNSGPAATGTINPPVNSVSDPGLVGGRFYYYAVWLYVPALDEWTRAAHTTGLAVQDYGYSKRLWELTPSIHRTTSGALLDQDNETLRSYYRMVGFQLDHLRAEYETLRYANDPHRVSGGLLSIMAKQYGQFFEPELGMKQMRQLLASTVYLYRNKGTVPGVEGFVKAISGYGAKVLPLKNLMLDYNDSSAEESIGRWTGTACTVSRYVADDVVAAAGEFYEGQRRVGLFKMTSTTTATSVMYLGVNGIGAASGYRIPVTGGQAYSFSGYVRSETTAVSCGLDFYWYKADGTSASTASNTGGSANSVVGAWTRLAFTATAPADAVYAGVRARAATTTVGEVTYWDAFQYEAGAAATAFTDARLIDIQVYAPRVNLVTNPNFEDGTTTGWRNVNIGGSFGSTSTVYAFSGTQSALVQTNGSPQTVAVAVSVVAGTTYTFSIYVRADAAASLEAQFGGASSGVVAVGASGWTRVRVTGTAATTGPVDVLLLFRGTGVTFYIDAALMEQGAGLFDYFDGTTYAFTGESMWEGTPNASRSHYYPQRKAKNYRMNSLLPSYTPMGSSYRLRYALSS